MAVFPARAGVIPAPGRLPGNSVCLSRTSGGDPKVKTIQQEERKSFPHERG